MIVPERWFLAWTMLGCSIAPVAGLAHAPAAQAQVLAGVRVSEVAAGSAAEKAGVKGGDELTGWNWHDRTGVFTNPFHLLLLEDEYAVRGPVQLAGTRAGRPLIFTLRSAPWQISSIPALDQTGEAADYDAKTLAQSGKRAEAGACWEQLARTLSGVAAAWFNSRAALIFADAERWPDTDRNFAAALEQANSDPAGRLEIEAAWAGSYQRRRLWDQARTHYDAAIGLAKALDARLLQARMLTGEASTYTGQRHPANALPLHEQALAIRRNAAPGTHLVADSLQNVGTANYNLHKLDTAEASFREALKLIDSPTPDLLQAKTLHSLGLIAHEEGKLPEARNLFERSLTISALVEPQGEQWASTNTSLGTLFRRSGDFTSAERCMRASLEARQKLAPGSLAVASSLTNLGVLHRERGDFILANKEFEQVLAIDERLAPHSEDTAATLTNLGTVAQSRGDLALAANFYERSLAISSQISPGSYLWGGTLVNLGQVRQDQGNTREAERLYEQAASSIEWQKRSPFATAGVHRALGELYFAESRLPDAADADGKALAILQKLVPEGLDEAAVAGHLAEVDRRLGDWTGAAGHYNESLTIRERLVPDTDELAESLHGMGLVAIHNGKSQDALPLLSRAVDAIEAQSSRLGGSELVNAAFRANYAEYYQDLADLLLELNRGKDAFGVTEKYRARSLLRQLAQRDLNFAGSPKELIDELHANAKEYEGVQADFVRAAQSKDKNASDSLQAKLVDLEASRNTLIDKIRQQAPGYAAISYPSPLSASQVQAVLEPGTVLMSYLVESAATRLFVLDARGAAVSVYTLPITATALRNKVESFRKDVQESSGKAQQLKLRAEAKALYELLLRPAEPRLQGAERLLILPDGPLHALPFAALLRDETFVAEWKPVSVTLSATLFAELKRKRRAPETYRTSLAAFGNAIYSPAAETADADVLSVRHQHRSASGGGLAALPFSGVETERIGSLFPDSAALYEGAQATEEHAKAVQSDVRFIHFAVHGLLDEEHPLNSALVFTTPPKGAMGGQNGYLQAWELYQDVHWNADLVVLSACESALGKEVAGEGLIGLTRAVHYAGARSVIASLWSVDDRRTEQFMTELYTNLRNGKPKDEALRAAQLKLLHSRAGAAPFYWAAFTLQGDWR